MSNARESAAWRGLVGSPSPYALYQQRVPRFGLEEALSAAARQGPPGGGMPDVPPHPGRKAAKAANAQGLTGRARVEVRMSMSDCDKYSGGCRETVVGRRDGQIPIGSRGGHHEVKLIQARGNYTSEFDDC